MYSYMSILDGIISRWIEFEGYYIVARVDDKIISYVTRISARTDPQFGTWEMYSFLLSNDTSLAFRKILDLIKVV